MESLRFAVVDVETTGGFASGHRITEIGIAISNGQEIVEEYQTLINPEREIPNYITALTGIDDDMVSDAPVFAEVAEEIITILGNAIFVAHHVDFDYSFIRNEFSLAGIDYKARKLCTVRYARSLLKDQPRFGLAKLAERFKIVNENPHRALSDAQTAASILHRLIEIDGGEILKKKISKLEREVKIPVNLPPGQYHELPHAPGVYFFYGADGKPLYIGKAKDLKARITSHFREVKAKRTQAFMREITRIETHLTGSELLALVKEDVEIRKYWPPHNSAQKRMNISFHILKYTDQTGAMRLGIKRAKYLADAINTFQTLRSARLWLHEQINSFELNPDYCGMPSSWYEFEIPTDKVHNAKVEELLALQQEKYSDFIVIEKGRKNSENGFVWVKDGLVHAYGFAPSKINWTDIDAIAKHAEEIYSSPTLEQIVASHLVSAEDVVVHQLKN